MKVNKLIATIILLLVNLILIFFFVIPKYQESNELRLSFLSKQAENSNRLEYRAKLSGILEDIEKRRDDAEKIDVALPSNFYMSPIINFFQKLANQNNLVLKLIVFSKDILQAENKTIDQNLKKKIRSVSLTVNLSGGYQDLKNFLSLLDRSARIFNVESISFSSPQDAIILNGIDSLDERKSYDFRIEIKTNTY